MKALRVVFRLWLVMGFGLIIPILPVAAQAPPPKETQTPASVLRKLTGDDVKRAEDLDKAIQAAEAAGRWDEAIARAEELLALRTQVQGPKYFETVNMQWRLKALRRVARMPDEDRVAYQTAKIIDAQAGVLHAQGKYALTQPLFEKTLEIRRRLLTDEHPETANSYSNLAVILNDQGKYSLAQPLYEKALEIRRRLLTDEHPDTAESYGNLGANLNDLGKPALAQPLVEKALEIHRRLLTDDHTLTAESYSKVASNLDKQGKFALSQPLYEKALEIRRRLLTDEHPDTAASYDNLALNLTNQGKYDAARPLYEKAIEIDKRLFKEEHPAIAISYHSLANNFYLQGKFDQAQPRYEKALELDRRLLTDNHPISANTYNSLALNLEAQGKFIEAQSYFEKALEIAQHLFTEDHLDTARYYNSLAMNLYAQGRFAQAQPLAEKALEIRRRLLADDNPTTANSFNNVAANLNAQGKYAQAQPLLEKSLAICRRMLNDNHPITATSLNNLAGNLRSQGKYALAQPLFEKALQIRLALFSEDNPATAESYNRLAQNLDDQGKYPQAQSLHEKALDIRRRLLTENHPSTATSYNSVAMNLYAQGKYAEAQPLYQKALDIRLHLLTVENPQTAESIHNVAMNLYAQGKYVEAQPQYEQALEIRRRLFTDDHPFTALNYNSVARNLNAQGKYAGARDHWLKAVKSLDAARLRIAFAGLERSGRVNEPVRPALAAVLARLGQPALAWQALEEDLGRGLLDELAVRENRLFTTAERDRFGELTAALEKLDKLVETTPKDLDQSGRAKRFEELKRERELASIALGEFQTKLLKDHDALAGQVASLEEIQAALPADAALVTWVDLAPVGPNATDPDGEHWGVVVRSRGIPIWVPMAGTGADGLWSQEDTALSDQVRRGLRRRPGTSATDLRPLLERLRLQRLQPLASALKAAPDGLPAVRRLVVLPSRAMAGIPVEVMLAPDDNRIVSYAPSATVFRTLREQPHPDRGAGLLALGDPIYENPDSSSDLKPVPSHGLLVNVVTPDSNAATHGLKDGDVLLAYNGVTLKQKTDLKVVAAGDKPIEVEIWRSGKSLPRELDPGKLGVVFDPRPAPEAIAANRAIHKVLMASRSGDDKEFAPLPGTRYEVEMLAGLFKADDRPARILVEAAASEPELDRLAASGELGRFRFIHLATHGVIDEGVPLRSAVILTQIGLPDPLEQVLHQKPVYDGRLTVREIQRGWNLKAELVTLSACETALGRDDGGEGFVGFTQALLMSGTRSVCLSLWKVDDTATALLMQRFYADLLGSRPGLGAPMAKAEALSEAKTWLRTLSRAEALAVTAKLSGGIERGKGAKARPPTEVDATVPSGGDNDRPYASPHFWGAFVLAGDPD
jgi:tetratricopeptide (TPR) repeat protein